MYCITVYNENEEKTNIKRYEMGDETAVENHVSQYQQEKDATNSEEWSRKG